MSKPNDDNSTERNENIFEILDGTISKLNQTKKLFMIMVLSILIIPPIALLVSVSILDNPFRPDEEIFQMKKEIRELKEKNIKLFSGLENLSPEEKEKKINEIVTSQEFKEINEKLEKLSQDKQIMLSEKGIEKQSSDEKNSFEKDYPHGPSIKPLQFITFIISGVWLGIGVRQWIVMSKWTKKYARYKKLQDEVNKKLDDSEDKKDEQS